MPLGLHADDRPPSGFRGNPARAAARWKANLLCLVRPRTQPGPLAARHGLGGVGTYSATRSRGTRRLRHVRSEAHPRARGGGGVPPARERGGFFLVAFS